jgi:hypothetical protein
MLIFAHWESKALSGIKLAETQHQWEACQTTEECGNFERTSQVQGPIL